MTDPTNPTAQIEGEKPDKPETARAKIVYFIFLNIPRVLLLFMIALIVVLAFAIVEKKNTIVAQSTNSLNEQTPLLNVVVLPLTPTEMKDRLNLPGSIEPWVDLKLKSKIRGTVMDLSVTEGDEVSEGQVLAKLETADYEITLDRAKAAYKLALSNYTREKSLHDRGVVPVAQMQAKETALQTAKADLENAELNLSRCTIKAPIDGVIQYLNVKRGLLLNAGDPVATILKIDQVKAVVGIPESDISAVQKLETVDITIQALDNRVIKGKLHFLSPAPETTARLYRMELAIDNTHRDIRPGMFFRADVVKKTVPEALAVPLYSVISRNNEQFVFVDEDGTAKKRPVTLGIMEKWMVQVTQGLSSGDRIVVEGHRDLEDNQGINVVKVLDDLGDVSL